MRIQPPYIPPHAGGEASNSRTRGEKQATAARGGRMLVHYQEMKQEE